MQLAELSRALTFTTGKLMQKRDWGRLGRICKQYSDQEIKDALGLVRKKQMDPMASLGNGIGYLHSILAAPKRNKKGEKKLQTICEKMTGTKMDERE